MASMFKSRPHGPDQCNPLIAMPRKVTTDDGRVLSLVNWEPSARVGHMVTVKIEAIVQFDEPLTHQSHGQ